MIYNYEFRWQPVLPSIIYNWHMKCTNFQCNIPTLLQVMACRLFGAKPLSEPMLPYCQLDPMEHISVKYCLRFKRFHSRKCTSKWHLRNGGYFSQPQCDNSRGSEENLLSFSKHCACWWPCIVRFIRVLYTHYSDVIMGTVASKITSLTIVYSNRLFRRRSKKTSKLRVTGLCVGNSPGTGEFPAQMASNVENVSIWWRHHDIIHVKG